MKKVLLLLLLSCRLNLHSETLQTYQAVTTSQTGGRYEILQSEIKRTNTFKLDKYTGAIYVLVTPKKDWFSWQEVPKGAAPLDTVISDKINYPLFMGGTMAKDCFLLKLIRESLGC